MSKSKTDPEAPKKKGKTLVVKLLAGMVLIGCGGGAAYALMLQGVIGGGAAAVEDKSPKLVRKGETDTYAAKGAEGEGDKAVSEAVDGVGGDPYKTSYYVFAEEFTSNLADSGNFVQLSLAAATNYDGRVLMWVKKHELAIRSAILVELAATSEDEAYSVAGKAHLQKRLADAINRVLQENEGFGGIKAVYFKAYIVQ